MVGSGGDPVAFFSYQDAEEIQFVKDNWAIRNARERALAAYTQRCRPSPRWPTGLARKFADNPELHNVNAILVRLAPGADPAAVAAAINRWEYFTASTTAEQSALMLQGSVALARRQTGLFRVLLTIVTTVIIAQIIYTMTLEKLKPIALLKLIGAPSRLIAGLVLQQSLALGLIGYVIALVGRQPDLRQMAAPGDRRAARSTAVAGHRGGHLSGGQRDGIATRTAGGGRRGTDGVMPWKSSASRT